MSRLINILVLSFIMISSFSNKISAQEPIKGKFEHVVLFYLKNPDNEKDQATLEKGLRDLIEASEYIVSAHLGVPAMTDREIVDNSYSFNYTVTFESKETQDKYQTEPAHLAFVEEYKHLWEKVIIYDSINLLDSEE